jgi:hypothetical protein
MLQMLPQMRGEGQLKVLYQEAQGQEGQEQGQEGKQQGQQWLEEGLEVGKKVMQQGASLMPSDPALSSAIVRGDGALNNVRVGRPRALPASVASLWRLVRVLAAVCTLDGSLPRIVLPEVSG